MQYKIRYTKNSDKIKLIFNLLEPSKKYTVTELSKLLKQDIGIISEQLIAMEKLKMIKSERIGRNKFILKIGNSKPLTKICPCCNQVVK